MSLSLPIEQDRIREKISILIIEDSLIYRKILKDIVELIPNAEVIEIASSGERAMVSIKKNPRINLVFVDLIMPGMDGLEILKQIKEYRPNLPVVMISGADYRDGEITMKALKAGALDFIAKPNSDNVDKNIKSLQRSIERIIQVYRESKKPKKFTKTTITTRDPENRSPKVFDCIAIGISTGGPKALAEIIPQLDPNLPVPIFLVQHMPPSFTGSLATYLNNRSAINVKEGEDGEIAKAGTIYIAPGDNLMTLDRNKLDNNNKIIITKKTGRDKAQSIDILLHSLSEKIKNNVLVCILTGMGTDGTEGLKSLKNNQKSYAIAQDQKTSTIFGMPKSIIDQRLADIVLPLNKIPLKIKRIFDQSIIE